MTARRNVDAVAQPHGDAEASTPGRADTSAQRLVHAFNRLDIRGRAELLGQLLASVGTLALAVVGNGIFAKYVHHARRGSLRVAHDDVARATPRVIAELVHYVRQSDPGAVERILRCLGPSVGAPSCAE